MCGIAGQLNAANRPCARAVVGAMGHALAHRGPDGDGCHIDGPLGLAHRRLKIIDLSPAGAQPMANEDRSVWVTYNGEIYNFQELRRDLEARGHRFQSQADTEVIVHAYEEWGVASLAHFNGMFAFGLWDARARRLWLVRDRLGVKPLFYSRLVDGTVLFGSEIKAILADPRIDPRIDYEVLAYYLALNYVPAPYTLFAGIRQIEPGHYLLIEDDRLQDVAYWDVVYDEDPPPRADSVWIEEFQALLSDSVRRRLVSDVPFGAFLSGGVDSSGIVYWMARHMTTPVKTFTIGFGEDTYDELPYARAMAGAVAADHRERVVAADAATLLPRLVRHAEEPTADSSMVAVYCLAQLAREHVTMVLGGDGADDILAGYETHQAYYVRQVYRWLPSAVRRRLIAPLVRALPAADTKVSLETKLKRFVAAADLPWEEAHASWRIIFDAEARAKLLAPLAQHRGTEADATTLYTRAFSRTNARHPLNRMLYVDTRLYLPADMLVKIDRMTMAHGLEAREPYLDYRLVEFAARVPPRLKLKGFRQRKYLLKEGLRGKVPDQVLFRKKQGFNVPKARWMRQGLKSFVRDHLSEAAVRETGLLDPAAVTTLLDEHFTGRADRSHQIWGLLVLVLWFHQFVGSRMTAEKPA